MRIKIKTHFLWLLLLFIVAVSARSQPVIRQGPPPAAALLTKTRALYDAPFARNLITVDCAVSFDWKQHIIDLVGTVPPQALPLVSALQPIQHRVLINESGAVVSAIPMPPDLSAIAHAADLEKALTTMVAAGINAWIPFATDEILPRGPTSYVFETITGGYKLSLKGNHVQSQLLLGADLRITSGVAQQPEPLRFDTVFANGPQGFLLSSIKTGNPAEPPSEFQATFEYNYQTVDGFQLPSMVKVSPSAGHWHFALTDCKTVRGIRIEGVPLAHPKP